MIISSILYRSLFYIQIFNPDFFFLHNFMYRNMVIDIVLNLPNVIIAILLFKDMKFETLAFKLLTCVVAFFMPLLGILIYGLLFLTNDNNKIEAKI